jgi:hypothetical protein
MDRFWTVLAHPDGLAVITGTNPFPNFVPFGNGSLELSTTGSLFDWGFYGTLSGPTPWGTLAEITALSFSWWRSDIGFATNPHGFNPWPDAPWLAQSPVLRLLIGQENGGHLVYRELVWEKYYNAPGPYTTPYETWNFENLLGQNFWHNVGGSQYWVNSNCGTEDLNGGGATPPPVWPGGLLLATPSGWVTGTFADPNATAACQAIGFNLAGWSVYGIAVGVGSNWPDAYRGFVDYVRLAFNNEDVVYANFELPDETVIPEPSTVILLGTGLAALGIGQLRRRRTTGAA